MRQDRRYRLLRTIGRGGMAQVYEAAVEGESGYARRVAIKRVLPEHSLDRSVRAMFVDEARIASRLYHGNIVQVLDYGFVDGAEFLVMEYVDGVDARRAVKQGLANDRPMPVGVALHIMTEIAHALAYVHQSTNDDGTSLGLVHRDVSPSNILMSWDGDVKLTDFGIAFAEEREERTATGVVKGKVSFMSPEQALGSPVTGAADVFSLAATVHALIAGAPPELGSSEDGVAGVLSVELPSDIAELLRRCLKVDATVRPTARELAAEAGRLAVDRLRRDGRGALREWLAEFRALESKTSALDQMLGLFLVPADPETRNFTVSRSSREETTLSEAATVAGRAGATPGELRLGSNVDDIASPGNESEAVAAHPRASTRWVAIASIVAAIAVVAYVGGNAMFTSVGPRANDEATEDAEVAVAPDASVEPILDAAFAELSRAAFDASEPNSEIDARAGSPVAFLHVPAALRGHDVFVDGVPIGRAPLTRSLSVGPHTVRVRDRSTAESLLERTYVLRAENTRDRPLVVQAPIIVDEVDPPSIDPPVVTSGWLRVGGSAVAGHSVALDGTSIGYAPTERRVSTGTHIVRVTNSVTGELIVQRSIPVTVEHTREAPALLILQ